MDWMMAHPWMTLCIAIVAILALVDVTANICRTIFLVKTAKKGKSMEEIEDKAGESKDKEAAHEVSE